MSTTRIEIDHRTPRTGADRHPEKAHRPDNPIQRKPSWIRVKAPTHPIYHETRELMREQQAGHGLRGGGLPEHRRVLVAAPRHHDDHGRDLHARLFLLQRRDRHARSRSTPTNRAGSGEAVATLGLRHVVITSVDRDDLKDGGAEHFAQTIRAIRASAPDTTIEILTPDFLRKDGALEVVVAARPDVFNHNLETVPGLYPTIRPGARYYHSLRLLDRVKQLDPTIFTKSGIMVGLGEERDRGAAGDGRPALGGCRFPHHRPVPPAHASSTPRSIASSRPRNSRTTRRPRAARVSCWSRQRR